MRMTLVAVLAVAVSAPVAAQEISPSFDAPTAALGRATIEGAAANHRGSWNRRGASASTASRQRAACASLPRFRARYGADNAKVVALGRRCRQAGLAN